MTKALVNQSSVCWIS